ncbi:penicillin-binding protein 1C [Methylolobus aquaticus]
MPTRQEAPAPVAPRRLRDRRSHGLRSIAWVAAILLAVSGAGAGSTALPTPAEVRAAWRSSEAWLLDRHGEVLHERRMDRNVRRLAWTTLDNMSPAVIRAVIQAEDRRFYRHSGVDWRAVAAATWDRLVTSRRRGASTLSMQLAALLDRDGIAKPGHRSIPEKLAQMRAALRLEETWRKDEILEAYLNLAVFRGELQGIGTAAQGWFGKEPSGLNDGEAVLLAALLPAPNAEPGDVGRRACALAAVGNPSVDCHELQALAARLARPPAVAKAANLAPQLAQQLLREPGEAVTTTLDARLQRLAIEALTEQLSALIDRNVRDGAVVVADNASGDVLAYVASGGPYSRSPAVDGARAPRQAGSTLKPFLYALALERRHLTAASLLNDSPVNLETPSGLYIPQNYDRDFKGMVSVRTALAGSLNVPAVRALALVGVTPLRDYLQTLGYAGIDRDGEYYGYSLALGSAEVSLLEQVAAYRALATGGRGGALRLRLDAAIPPIRPTVDESAAWVVADILADRASRAITFGLDSPLSTRYWSAVKTGTSKDMRDNWCIGFSRRYTVGVWVGNFEGDAMHDVSGITGAAPVWQAIMDALHEQEPGVRPPPPSSVVSRDIVFRPPLESPRREWFLSGTEVREVVLNEPATRGPHIVSPPQGVVIALDPDIPPAHQAVIVTVEAPPPGAELQLDGIALGSAATHHAWRPTPGRHRLALIGAQGTVIDAVEFSVRPIANAARVNGNADPDGQPHQDPAGNVSTRH